MRKQVFKKFFVFSVLFSACLNAWAEDYAAGTGSTASGGGATAVGINNTVSSVYSTAVGRSNTVSGTISLALGNNNKLSGSTVNAVGNENNVGGFNSNAFGSLNKVYANLSTAIGYGNTIGSRIEGDNPTYSNLHTYVLGSFIQTSASGAVVLGYNSRDGGDNTVSVGSARNLRKIVFVNDGTISAKSKDAINGSQLNSVLQNATGINVTNWKTALGITDGGNTTGGNDNSTTINTVIKYLGGGASSLTAPTYTITNISGDIPTANSYNNVGDALTALDNNTKTLNTSLLNKANKNADNLSASDITTWQGKLGNGTIADGNTGLVTGGVVATALQQKADKTEVEAIKTTLTNTNTTIDGKLNKDVDNISATGIANIKNYAQEAVKVTAGDNVSVTTTEDATNNTKTYTVAVSNTAIKAAVQNDLNAKANKNADNLTVTDVKAWQDKLGNGELTSGNKGLVTGGVVADALALKADKTALDALANSVASANTSLTAKADKDLSNLSDTGATKVKTLAKEAVSVKAGNNVTVSENVDTQTGNKTYTVGVDNDSIKNVAKEAIKPELDTKANKNADNLADSDVTNWQQKLGNGKVEAGNKGLVTGDTVNEAIIVVNKRIDEVVANPSGVSGQVLEYLGGGATATEAPTYTITDIATGQNIEHNNVGSALQQLNNNQNLLTNNVIGLQKGHEELKRTVSQNRKEAQAGVAAAVAIASLPTSNEPGKTVFSMAGGSFKGQSAMAMGLSKRTENGKFLLKANASMNTRGDTAIGAGVGFVW